MVKYNFKSLCLYGVAKGFADHEWNIEKASINDKPMESLPKITKKMKTSNILCIDNLFSGFNLKYEKFVATLKLNT